MQFEFSSLKAIGDRTDWNEQGWHDQILLSIDSGNLTPILILAYDQVRLKNGSVWQVTYTPRRSIGGTRCHPKCAYFLTDPPESPVRHTIMSNDSRRKHMFTYSILRRI